MLNAIIFSVLFICLCVMQRQIRRSVRRHVCPVCRERVPRYDQHLIDHNSPCSVRLAADPSCRMCLNPVEYSRDQCSECKDEPVGEKRLPVPADFLKGAVFATFGPLDLDESIRDEIAADDKEFAARMEELDQFLAEQDEEFKKEAELDREIDEQAAALETHVEVVDITEYDGE